MSNSIAPAAIGPQRPKSPRAIAAWLLVCCALLLAMIVLGGVTRLTHSGLSIVEWQPIAGTLPPMSPDGWTQMFRKYQATPEYRLVNHGMGLEEFRSIFWWEYFHRLLGRAIGFVFLAPLVWFAARRSIPAGLAPRLVGLFVLGGAQGAMGWYMVMSGLVHDPHVSALRLAAHLALALLLFGAMLWTALTLLHPARGARSKAVASVARWSATLSALVFVMALSGALVAGVRAGLIYNTFPLMNGYVVPPELLSLQPWYRNVFQNLATVQFDHRVIAWTLIVLVPSFWWRARSIAGVPRRARTAVNLLLAMLALQVSLGIGTLLLVVPVGLAAMHQAGAVLLLASALNATHALFAGSSSPRIPRYPGQSFAASA